MRWRLLAVSGLIALLSALAASTLSGGGAKPAVLANGELVVYAEFGLTADTVYEASPGKSASRRRLFDIRHAREFGVVPSLAPDGRSFAYTILPPATAAPAPDSPAELWVATIGGGAQPRRIGEGFDLLVKPVWANDGKSLIARRHNPGGAYQLVRVDVATGAFSAVVSHGSSTPFPVGFAPDDSGLFYVTLDGGGSDLLRFDFASNSSEEITKLSDGLTRDWALSPSGKGVAFLAVGGSSSNATSRLNVLDMPTGLIIPSTADGDEFGPAWTPAGELTIGRLTRSAATTGVYTQSGPVGGIEQGFDVPLAWSRSGASIAVRTFDGSFVSAPGRASLDVLAANGDRKTITTGEVTFIGWTYR